MSAERKEAALVTAEVPRPQQPLACSLTRKCSTCGRSGHNSRTCLENREGNPSRELGDAHFAEQAQTRCFQPEKARDLEEDDGAVSDESAGAVHNEARKKGIPWTEKEHRSFLAGLQKLGKGDWRGISRHYVQSRSPTQVASHAQKYFIRQSADGKRKRRTSLFDLVPDKQQEQKSSSARTETANTVQKQQSDSTEALHPAFSGMMPGPEAFALALWYQTMLAQQGSIAWMQAIYGQQGQAIPALMPPHMATMMATAQDTLPFHFMQQQGIAAGQQQPDMPGQALAIAFFMQQQQQQLAAMRPVAGHSKVAAPLAQPEPSGDSGRAEASLEHFDHGMLFKPKAQKAKPSPYFGEMPSYMLDDHQTPSCLRSGSGESQDTAERASPRLLSGARPRPDLSGSSYVGSGPNILGGDEHFSTKVAVKADPASSKLSARSSASEVGADLNSARQPTDSARASLTGPEMRAEK